MVEVVFHVGAHKCATTAIQAGLGRIAASDPCIVYVPPSRRGGAGAPPGAERAQALHDLVRLVGRGEEAALPLDGVVDGLCRLIEAHGDRERIVFSDEYILGGMPGLRWSFYPRAGLAREAIEGVGRRFPTRVLLQSRETAGYLKSSHQFRVRMGMTLGYAGFLEAYDLSSISWEKLGATLFDGAAYEWRVLPIEWLGDDGRAADVGEILRFVAPGLDEAPLDAPNASSGPLMRAATLVFNRARKSLDTRPDGPVALALSGAEADIADASETEANAMIERVFTDCGLKAGDRLVNMIRLHFEEERAPSGFLQKLLMERFAPDYAAFLARYAAPRWL